jgi:metal-responsive CopG/Arc/MetJ family transcriptional regulator
MDTRITVRLPERLLALLEQQSQKKRVSKSELIREILNLKLVATT